MCGTCGCKPHDFYPKSATSRQIKLDISLLNQNQQQATHNRARFQQLRLPVVNLMSSPGSGKTRVLEATLPHLKSLKCAVIEGDLQTRRDAERIKKTGTPAVQINTGKGCHLDARSIDTALDQLDIASLQLLFIENVGNLVCPAAFDLGESLRVVVLAITEGEDKPLKYPDMFYDADVVLLNKMDLLPHLEVNLDDLYDNLKQIQPNAVVLPISAQTGEGIEGWIEWLTQATRKFTSA
ncbi:MAG: hydrogenase nickel incorporation protein HypB [Hahellaceae bacterium]|jgi:hydrogenase nickel incorporation protein HypB|nr:hydrogenase nickel incorporation protein HypB [Hahellaceae bacterium]